MHLNKQDSFAYVFLHAATQPKCKPYCWPSGKKLIIRQHLLEGSIRNLSLNFPPARWINLFPKQQSDGNPPTFQGISLTGQPWVGFPAASMAIIFSSIFCNSMNGTPIILRGATSYQGYLFFLGKAPVFGTGICLWCIVQTPFLAGFYCKKRCPVSGAYNMIYVYT